MSAAVSASGYVNRTAPLSQVNLGLGRRIDQNQTSLRSGLPSDPCPVYVRPRPPSPAVAIVSSHADSSIQITKPHRVTNQNSESQMNTLSRFTVSARLGEVPTLVRVQHCELGRPPSTCARPPWGRAVVCRCRWRGRSDTRFLIELSALTVACVAPRIPQRHARHTCRRSADRWCYQNKGARRMLVRRRMSNTSAGRRLPLALVFSRRALYRRKASCSSVRSSPCDYLTIGALRP